MFIQRLLLLSFALIALTALSPMSPVLEKITRQNIMDALVKAGMAENAAGAVVIDLQYILGAGEKADSITDREPYEHLPYIDAKSSVGEKGCMKADMLIWMRAHPEKRITLKGVYCRTQFPSAYEWRTVTQQIEGHF